MRYRLLLLPSIMVALFALTWSPTQPAMTAPIPKDARQKPWSELLIGKWKRSESWVNGIENTVHDEITLEFTPEGLFILCGAHSYPQRLERKYRLKGNLIEDPDNPSGMSEEHGDIVERIHRIESLTEDRLLRVGTVRWRWGPEKAESMASEYRPLEQVLAEVRVELHRSVWVRLQ